MSGYRAYEEGSEGELGTSFTGGAATTTSPLRDDQILVCIATQLTQLFQSLQRTKYGAHLRSTLALAIADAGSTSTSEDEQTTKIWSGNTTGEVNVLGNVTATGNINFGSHLEPALAKKLITLLGMNQSSLPPQVKFRKPFIFTDANDERMAVNLDFITSLEAFLAVLEIRFKDLGAVEIKQKQFQIDSSASQTQIDLTRRWELCFKPGGEYDMSMLFEESHQTAASSCPCCQTECSGRTGDRVQWQVPSTIYM